MTRVESGVGSPAALRAANRRRVLDVLRRRGPASQAEVARCTGLSRATISNIVRELVDSERVVVRGSAAGRRAEVALNPAAGLVAGVDFGHRHLRVALADLGHAIGGEDARLLTSDHGADEDIPLAEKLLDELLAAAGASRAALLGVGLGLPAPVDPATGRIRAPAILPGWSGVPAAEALSARLGVPVLVDNDANLGALGELTWGAGVGARNLVYVKAATGVGAGLVLEGELYRGTGGAAGEIGHIVVDERGPLCQCGDRGCLETIAGADAILALLRTAYGAEVGLPEVIARALAGDPGCHRVLADAGRAIGVAVAGLCNLLAPERVVLGGTLASAGGVVLGPLRDVVRRHAMPGIAEQVSIVGGRLGERAELLGAVASVLRAADRTPQLS